MYVQVIFAQVQARLYIGKSAWYTLVQVIFVQVLARLYIDKFSGYICAGDLCIGSGQTIHR